MDWNKHLNLEGSHAFLSASKFHWINYDEDKLINTYKNFTASQRGTRLHEWAAETIKLGRILPKTTDTINMYVNDAIRYHMSPEVVLRYSDYCFGTADAIAFNDKKGFLRIHDLKTGEIPAHMEQLYIYVSLFCLEYKVKPGDIDIETRIYQSNNVIIAKPEPQDILPIIDKIIKFDKIIAQINNEERI